MNDIDQQDPRPIPPLPGGGSWRFDEEAWEWVSRDTAPAEPAAQPDAAHATHIIEKE
jgi:hypothetical protein